MQIVWFSIICSNLCLDDYAPDPLMVCAPWVCRQLMYFFPAFIWALNEVIDENTRYVQPQLPETNGRESKWLDSHWLAAAFSCSCQSFDFIGLYALLFLFLDFESKVRASLLFNIETEDFAKYHIYKCLFFTTNSANKYSKDGTGLNSGIFSHLFT